MAQASPVAGGIPPILRDAAQQAAFDRDGYVVVDFLEPAEVETLAGIIWKLHPGEPRGFFSTTYLPDLAFKQEVSRRISEQIAPAVERTLCDYRALGASYLVKAPDPKSELSMHQDWTIVDERRYRAVNIWCPLTDTNDSNGTVEVLRGSHEYLRVIRAPTLPFALSDQMEQVKDYLTPLYLRAGQAAILSQSLVHYSSANRSGRMRLAFTAGVVSRDAPIRFHYNDPEKPGRLELWDQPDDFFLRFGDFFKEIFERPRTGSHREDIDYENPRVSPEQLVAWVREAHGGRLPEKPVRPPAREPA